MNIRILKLESLISLILLTNIIIFFSNFKARSQETGWIYLSSGIQKAKITAKSSRTGSSISFHIVRVEPNKTNIKVLDAYTIIQARGSKYSPYSLNELRQVTNQPIALINGGYTSSFTQPVPTGLLIQNGNLIAQMNSQDNYFQGGILCITKNGSARIIKRNKNIINSCYQALQNGPLVVEQGKNLIVNKKDKFTIFPYERSLIAIDKQNRVLLIRTSEASLSEIANVLIKQLSASTALNLSGSTDSGLSFILNNRVVNIGHVDSTIASAIAVYPRK